MSDQLFTPRLLTVAEACDFLHEKEEVVLGWVQDDKIPYVRLPDESLRIPLEGLISSLSSLYDLVGYLREIEAWAEKAQEELGMTPEEFTEYIKRIVCESETDEEA